MKRTRKLPYAKLTPLKHQKGLQQTYKMATFDCETKDGLKGTKLFCWALAYSEQGSKYANTLQGYEDLQPLFDFLQERLSDIKDNSEILIYVHNLGFDIRFIEDYCIRHRIERMPILSGSKMIAYMIPSLYVRFVDSVQFLFSSQEQAEKDFEVDINLRKIDCKDIFEKEYEAWNEEEKERVFAHNKNDVLALYEIMKQYRKDIFEIMNVDLLTVISLASLSMKAYRKTLKYDIPNPFLIFGKDKDGKPTYRIEGKVKGKDKVVFAKIYDEEKNEVKELTKEEFVRESYFGGRNEVLDMNPHKDLSYFDIVSLYPFVMKNNPYPFGIPIECPSDEQIRKMINLGKLGVVQCKYYPPQNQKYPVLAHRKFGKVCFTNETNEGIFCTPEIIYAKKCGYKFEFKKGLFYPEKRFLFSEFITNMFHVKSTSKGGKRKAAKIGMNSLYGKFGQKFELEGFKIEFYTTEAEMQEAAETKSPIKWSEEFNMYYYATLENQISKKPFQNITIASFTTAYARLELVKMLHACEQHNVPVIYVDTDSVVISQDIVKQLMDGSLKFDGINVGKELGNWDIEYEIDYFKALAPKAYIYRVNNELKCKLKGVARDKIKELVKESKNDERVLELKLFEPIEMVERYATFKQALRGGYALNTRKLCKHYSFEYSKRIINKDGTTRAWNNKDKGEKIETM